MTRLTDHFTLEELTVTNTGIDNTPTAIHRAQLEITAMQMEKVRSALGNRPIKVTSGYRNPKVNKAVGGVPTSAHAKAYAVDFHVPGLTLDQIMAAISHKFSGVLFDQLIKETSRNVVHISFDPRLRRQVLEQAKGPGTPVVPWK